MKLKINVEISKIMMERREGLALQVELEMNGEIMEAVVSFKYLGGCFREDKGPKKYVEMKVEEEVKNFRAMKKS